MPAQYESVRVSEMEQLFPVNRDLLHPLFETYRLRPLDPEEDVTAYPLPGNGATQSRVGYNTHLLSFKEVRSRIGWNHLCVGDGGRGVFVDVDFNVVGFQLDVSVTFITVEMELICGCRTD